MMAVSAHKIGGPAGVGALLVKAHADGVRLIPGGGQEQGRRGGTEATALIAGFGAAAAAFPARYDDVEVRRLADKVEAGVGGVIFGRNAARMGNTVNFAVPGIGNAMAMMSLDLMGLSVSSGSACSSGKVGASHVLRAMGVATNWLTARCASALDGTVRKPTSTASVDGCDKGRGAPRPATGEGSVMERDVTIDIPTFKDDIDRATVAKVQALDVDKYKYGFRDRHRDRHRAEGPERGYRSLHLGQEERARSGCSTGGSMPIAAG